MSHHHFRNSLFIIHNERDIIIIIIILECNSQSATVKEKESNRLVTFRTSLVCAVLFITAYNL